MNLTFFNEPELKEALLRQLREDQVRDRFIQGTFVNGAGEQFKGCFIGCLTRTGKHEDVMRLYNLPLFVGDLGEYFFERVSAQHAREFSVPYIESIPVGVDLTMAWTQFALALMERLQERNRETRFNLPYLLEQAVQHFEVWRQTGVEPAWAAWAAEATRASGDAWLAGAAAAAWAVAGEAGAAWTAAAALATGANKAEELQWQLDVLLESYRGMKKPYPAPQRNEIVGSEPCLEWPEFLTRVRTE